MYTKLKRNWSLCNIMSSSIREKNTIVLLFYQSSDGGRIFSSKVFLDHVVPNFFSRALFLSFYIWLYIMPSLKTVEGWECSILSIETVENSKVTKMFCKIFWEALGDVAASNSSGFIDKQQDKNSFKSNKVFSLYYCPFCFLLQSKSLIFFFFFNF